MRIALTALTPKGPADVIVSGDDGATAGQVAEALQEAFAPKEHLASVIMHPRAAALGTALPASGPVLWAGGQQIPPDKPVARALRDGTVVTTIERAAAATSLAEPGGVAEVRVIGGPDAGTVHRLGPGATTIVGRDQCRARPITSNVAAISARNAGPTLASGAERAGQDDAHQIGGVAGAELFHHVGTMKLDGARADAQPVARLLVRGAVGNERRDFKLAARQL